MRCGSPTFQRFVAEIHANMQTQEGYSRSSPFVTQFNNLIDVFCINPALNYAKRWFPFVFRNLRGRGHAEFPWGHTPKPITCPVLAPLLLQSNIASPDLVELTQVLGYERNSQTANIVVSLKIGNAKKVV